MNTVIKSGKQISLMKVLSYSMVSSVLTLQMKNKTLAEGHDFMAPAVRPLRSIQMKQCLFVKTVHYRETQNTRYLTFLSKAPFQLMHINFSKMYFCDYFTQKNPDVLILKHSWILLYFAFCRDYEHSNLSRL